jgi:hypothetical protein
VSEDNGDEARRFLDNFLTRLLEADQTNQDLVQTLTLVAQQQERSIQQQQRVMQRMTELVAALQQQVQTTRHISSQLDGVAQRMDYLYEQMGLLGQAVIESREDESGRLPMVSTTDLVPPVGNPLSQAAGQWLEEQVDQFMQGGGRRRRR